MADNARSIRSREQLAETLDGSTLSGGDPIADQDQRIGQPISHYRIERKLGAGGMGQVYLATDVALGRSVALKILPDSFSLSLRQRLIREAWASARMQHPSIATFYEAGDFEGIAYIALEYVDGWTLSEEIARGPIAPNRAIAIAASLLEALTHAHVAGILHRDIKPSNVMCNQVGGVKLLDFGLARHWQGDLETTHNGAPDTTVPERRIDDASEQSLDETVAPLQALDVFDGLTQDGAVLGTLGYMSPEQVRGESVDARADLFSLGVVLYEMLTGRSAFRGGTARDRMISTMYDVPPPIGPGPESDVLNGILSRAVAKDVSKRYESASDFLYDLRALKQDVVPATDGLIAVVEPINDVDDPGFDWVPTAIVDAIDSQLKQHGFPTVPRPVIAAARSDVVSTEYQLGMHLGCRWMVDGNIEVDRDLLVVKARLRDVPAQRIEAEWEERAKLDELIHVQDSIASNLLQRLQSEETTGRSDRAATDQIPIDAYELCVRGRRELFRYGKLSFDRAEQLLSQAIEIQPDYAQALSSLSQIAGMRFLFSLDAATLEKALDLAKRSIAADPDLADPWVWRGYARSHQMFLAVDRGQVAEAKEVLRESQSFLQRGLELEPHSPMATYFVAGLAHIGCRFSDSAEARQLQRSRALALYQESLSVAPNSCWSWLGIGFVHLDLGNKAEAKWCLEKAVELEPSVTPPTAGVAVFLGECLRRLGHLDAAHDQCLQGVNAAEATDHMYRDTFRGVGLCSLGRTALELNDDAAASAAFRQAVLHLRGREKAKISGELMVQALAGEARAGQGLAPYKEAVAIFEAREQYDFGWLWWGWDEITLLELSRAARTLGKNGEADRFRQLAIDLGSVEAQLTSD